MNNIRTNNEYATKLTRNQELQKYSFSILELGTVSITEADLLMRHFVKLRAEEKIPDLLLILSHHPVLSLGARQLNEIDLMKPLAYFKEEGIELYKSNRGGGLTYHWPGQLVVYPVLKLRKEEQNIPNYMVKLEEVVLRTLIDLGIKAERKRDKAAQIGLWFNDKKIASMGISVSKWITSYGFAINVGGDFAPSNYIRPCGLNVKLTSVADIKGYEQNETEIINLVTKYFKIIFNRKEVNLELDKSISYVMEENFFL